MIFLFVNKNEVEDGLKILIVMKTDNRKDFETKDYRLWPSLGEVMTFNWIEFIICAEVQQTQKKGLV